MTIVIVSVMYFFFFKQKTAYEMRISDWSSDVCSSDLFADEEYIVEPLFALLLARAFAGLKLRVAERIGLRHRFGHRLAGVADSRHHHLVIDEIHAPWMAEKGKIGRASGRERVCQYVWISGVADSLNKNKPTHKTQ